MLSSLQNLLDQRQLWRARDTGDASDQALSSGWSRLDRELYGAGWPIANLSELLCVEPVLAWQLLQPALVQLSRQQRLLIWIGHGSPPYAPAWLRAGLNLGRCLLVRASEDEAPWAAEQALRLASGGAVVLQSTLLTTDRLRRLQLAAQAGNSFAFLLRPLSAQRQSTPAALRMSVLPAAGGLQISLHKRRGGTASAAFFVPVTTQASTGLGRSPHKGTDRVVVAGRGAVPIERAAETGTVSLLTDSVGAGRLMGASTAETNHLGAYAGQDNVQRIRQQLGNANDGFFNAG